MRIRAAVVFVAVVAATNTLLLAPVAEASAYRYWTYWQGTDDSWSFATVGPTFSLPADGAVEGWRFAVTSESGTASDQPRATPSFETICSNTEPRIDNKRVALVIDFGDAAEAPSGEAPPTSLSTCVSIDVDATGYDVLRSVSTVRTDDGLVCGIADYPVSECAPVVEDPLPNPSSAVAAPVSDETVAAPMASQQALAGPSSTGPLATVLVIAIIAGISSIIWWRRRRHG